MKITPNKYRSFLFGTLSILSLLFFIGGPDYQSPRSLKAIWNIGHIIYFALLPLFFFKFPKKKKIKPAIQAFIIISTTLVIGTAVEFFQYGLDRTPDIGDIFRDMIGALLAMFFLLPMRQSIPKHWLLIIKIVIVFLVATQFYPITIALIDEQQARKSFPILSDFQTPFQIHRWRKIASRCMQDTPNGPGNHALRVDLTTAQYSGTSLKYFPNNWKGYDYLQYRVFNPDKESIKLTCRIHDKIHAKGPQPYQDRFNRAYTLTHGWHTITISLKDLQQAPATRQMDLTQIRGVGIFAVRLPHPRTIYIDDLKLSQ